MACDHGECVHSSGTWGTGKKEEHWDLVYARTRREEAQQNEDKMMKVRDVNMVDADSPFRP